MGWCDGWQVAADRPPFLEHVLPSERRTLQALPTIGIANDWARCSNHRDRFGRTLTFTSAPFSAYPNRGFLMSPPVRGTITVVGAGQSGLSLAFGLLHYGYRVTVVTDRDAEGLRSGRIMSSQCMFDDAQGYERSLGLNMWDAACPDIKGLRIAAFLPDHPGRAALEWRADLSRPARSVDQRLKMSRWLTEFERRGGIVQVADPDLALLESACAVSDLVVVAAGKGSLSRLFPRDDVRSTFDSAQRSLAMLYVRGPAAVAVEGCEVNFSAISGVGEYITYPALAESGPCTIMLFESIPGGDMDLWAGATSGPELLSRARAVLNRYLPEHAVATSDADLIDSGATLVGAVTPMVRRPVATLPSGNAVFGIGDAIVVNDPITAQGANAATKCAEIYLHAITHHDGVYDEHFMNETFERFWTSVGEPVTAFTDHFLNSDTDHARDLHIAAARYPEIAQRLAACMNDPALARDFVFDPLGTYRAIDRAARAEASATKMPA